MGKQTVILINLLGVLGLCFVLTGAYVVQFAGHEFPCPLCLLQRMCVLGVAFGLMLNLRNGIKPAHYAISILSAILGAGIATRQIFLHIVPKPGDTGYGSPVLGLHLYTWCLLIFLASIVCIALLFFAEKQFDGTAQVTSFVPRSMVNAIRFTCWLLLIICVSNFVIAFLECGFGPCPDDPVEYQVLHGKFF
ncbi:disulfide bond formation protein B [Chitinophaga parva]|uniref:Disulfide bond formation protein B n=1 Tax=Chitinophaga parva TaxID=2169414 RepID=A0A2T7BKY1_9BACT|nr:disulfide bond formation protein B [Chitinophaga parva]PUZ28300.1 disulfide bond formation protein B [Chitinophaga parva]